MPVSFADYLDAKFPLDERSLNREVRGAFLAALEGLPQITCLDVGAGTGATFRRLTVSAPSRPLSLTALDRDSGLLGIARARAEKYLQGTALPVELRFAACEVRNYRPDRTYNVVTAHALLDLLPLAETLDRFARWLQPGGYLYASINYDGETAFLEPYRDPVFESRLLDYYGYTMEQRRVDGQPTGGALCGRRLHAMLPAYGFSVLAGGRSDWVVAPADGAYRDGDALCLQAVLEMICGEARSSALFEAAQLERWWTDRVLALQQRRLSLRVRHLDILARHLPD